MKVHIVARHVKLTKALKDFVQERIDKLQHYFDQIIWAQAILSLEKNSHKAELVVHAAKQTFKSKAESSDMYPAIDEASEKIEVQVKRYKEKIKSYRVNEDAVSRAVENSMPQADIRFSVVKQVPVLPMSADDAAFEMERLGYSFWLFLDESTKQVNVVFKRQDETYGLLQPVKKN